MTCKRSKKGVYKCEGCARVGFHSAALYHALRGAVRPLVELLGDDEDKTRANAAGALGNLVRNSPMLCPTLLQAHALEVRPLLHPTRQLLLPIASLLEND